MDMNDRIIGHIDMDAFFASVEERDKPWLKGLPIAIGADPKGGEGRGVLSTANYEARKYGLRSALPIQKAWAFSEAARKQGKPGVVFISGSGSKYGQISKEVFRIVQKYTRTLQATSIDEAYFDLTEAGSFQNAQDIAKKIKEDIKENIQLSSSIGIGPNKMIAKIASDFEKPDGLTVVSEEEAFDFLAPLPIRVIPGIGPKMGEKFTRNNVFSIEDARKLSWQKLNALFGVHGFGVYQKVRGAGSTNLENERVRKSIGQHHTFYEDTQDLTFVRFALESMCEEVFATLKKKKFKGFRTVTLTARFADFETKNRSLTSKEPVVSEKLLHVRALKLLLPFFERTENPKAKDIRMIGVRIEKLS